MTSCCGFKSIVMADSEILKSKHALKLFILSGEVFSLMVMLDQEEYLLAKAYSQE